MLSDKMCSTLEAIRPGPYGEPWDCVQRLSDKEGIPYKQAWARVLKAVNRGYAEYGTSQRGAWLTDEGKRMLFVSNTPKPSSATVSEIPEQPA